MGCLQCRAHHVDVADALEGVIDPPAGHLDEHLVNGLVEILGVETFGRAEGAGQVELVRIGVDADDATRPGLARTLHHGQTDAAEAEDGHGVARLHLGRVVDGADAGGHTTTQQADVLGIGIRIDPGQRDLGDDRVFAEGRAAHVVVKRLALVRKARRAVGHHALALGCAHRDAQVGLAGLAEQALAALGGVEGDDMIAGLDAGHTFTHLDDDARAFMAQHDREQTFRVIARQGEGIGMADAGVRDPDEHLALAWRLDVDLDDFQRLSGLEGHGCT